MFLARQKKQRRILRIYKMAYEAGNVKSPESIENTDFCDRNELISYIYIESSG
jgi:hypothetical protein